MPTDPRRRHLLILAIIALVSVLLAGVAVWQQSRNDVSTTSQDDFFPGFAKKVRKATHIHIASSTGAFDITFSPQKGWVVPQRYDFPASFDLVRRTLVGMAALVTLEPKTANPAWLHFIGLDAPPKGTGIAITVSNEKGEALAALIAGRSEDIGDSSGAIGLFVRRPNEDQSWLVRSVFDPRPLISDWLDKTVVDIDRARIQSVTFQPPNAPSFTVSRAKPADADFTLSPLSKPLPDASMPDALAAAITGFSFNDVRPAKDLDFGAPGGASHVVTTTFDGLRVTVNVLKQGTDYWASVSAEATDPSRTDANKEAANINAHASGWAYKLETFKGQLFMTTLDTLLKAAQGPAAGAPPPQQ
ncbi:MAG TPA: DUF4340 domain-containing protein [Rhizomicrobium sp.]|nr:DUF4340 domain-containing protein [Rhizomicrobium sp.]